MNRSRSVPPTTATAPTSRCSPRSRRASSCACSTTAGVETRRQSAGSHGALLARLSAGHQARPALRLPRARPVGAGRGALVQSQQAAARSIREGDRRRLGRGTSRCSRITSTIPTRRRTTSTARPTCRSRWWSIRPSTGKATRRRGRRGTRRSSTKRTSRASRCGNPSLPEHVRGTYGGLANPASDRVPAEAGRHRGRAAAGPPVRAGLAAARARACATTGATTRSATSRRTTSTRRSGTRGEQVQEFKGAGQGAAPRRHRSHPRRGLQPHRRGQSSRSGPVVQGDRQRGLLPARWRTTAATTWTTPAPATR